MYCINCGRELKDNEKFCPECGLKVETNQKETVKAEKVTKNTKVESEEKQYVKGMKNDTLLCIISLICMYGTGLIAIILTAIGRMVPFIEPITTLVQGFLVLGPLAAWILVIYTKVHYKDSRFAKILLIIYIVQLVLAIIAIILIIATCANIHRDCGSIGVIYNLLWL